MSFNFNPVHYKIGQNQFTNQTTVAPASPDEPFYQEVQKKTVKDDLAHQTKKHCVLHSLNIFAGRNIVDVPKYVEMNNTHWIEAYKPHAEEMLGKDGDLIGFLKVAKLYKTCTHDIQEGGIGGPLITKKYIEQNRKDFSLPPTSTMIVVQQAMSRFDERCDMEKTLQEIDDNPRLHRVIIILFQHCITFRKDQEDSWHVVDSMVLSQDKTASDALTRLQPKDKFLSGIVHKTVPKIREFYKAAQEDAGIRTIVYPSKEFAPETLKMTETLDLPLKITDLIDQYV
jgi:hypothetical protein